MRQLPCLFCTAFLIAALTSCGGSDVTPPDGGGGGGGGGGGSCPASTICASAQSFFPKPLTVVSGTVVTWSNKSGQLHNVTFDQPSAAQPGDGTGDFILNDDETHTRKFTTGASNTTYGFQCTIHPGMTGSLVVTP